MEQKIKDQGDYLSLSYLRSSKKMNRGNMGSPSMLKKFPTGKPLQREQLRGSFQEEISINLL